MSWRGLASGILCLLALGAMASGCGGDDDSDASPTRVGSKQTVAATAPARTPVPTSDPAIEALFGRWRTVITEGDNVILMLRAGRYSISRGAAAGAGRMDATAGEVEFSGSDLCDGTGRYQWSITNGELTFTSVERDECSGRSEVLDGKTYRK